MVQAVSAGNIHQETFLMIFRDNVFYDLMIFSQHWLPNILTCVEREAMFDCRMHLFIDIG